MSAHMDFINDGSSNANLSPPRRLKKSLRKKINPEKHLRSAASASADPSSSSSSSSAVPSAILPTHLSRTVNDARPLVRVLRRDILTLICHFLENRNEFTTLMASSKRMSLECRSIPLLLLPRQLLSLTIRGVNRLRSISTDLNVPISSVKHLDLLQVDLDSSSKASHDILLASLLAFTHLETLAFCVGRRGYIDPILTPFFETRCTQVTHVTCSLRIPQWNFSKFISLLKFFPAMTHLEFTDVQFPSAISFFAILSSRSFPTVKSVRSHLLSISAVRPHLGPLATLYKSAQTAFSNAETIEFLIDAGISMSHLAKAEFPLLHLGDIPSYVYVTSAVISHWRAVSEGSVYAIMQHLSDPRTRIILRLDARSSLTSGVRLVNPRRLFTDHQTVLIKSLLNRVHQLELYVSFTNPLILSDTLTLTEFCNQWEMTSLDRIHFYWTKEIKRKHRELPEDVEASHLLRRFIDPKQVNAAVKNPVEYSRESEKE